MSLNAADSNLGRIAFEREATFNQKNPTFNGQIARITSSSLAANKETEVSDELRADRMVGDLIETAFTSGGDLGFEFSLGGTWDDLLESLIAGTYAANPIAFSGSSTITAATQNVLAVGAFVGAVVGQYILIAGMTNAGNNGWHRITAKTDDDNVVIATPSGTLADETAAAAKITSKLLRNPGDPANIVKRSYNLEQYFGDIDVAQLFLGQRLGAMSLTTAANAIVAGTWTFLGATLQVQEASGPFTDTTVDPTTTDVVGATANVGGILIADQPAPCLVQSIDLTVDNALRNQNAVGSKYPCGIGYGRMSVNGTITVYFQDLTLYNQFLNHSDLSLEWGFTDLAGNGVHFYLPRVKIATDTPALEGIDTDVLEAADFQAIAFDPGAGDPYQIQICVATPA